MIVDRVGARDSADARHSGQRRTQPADGHAVGEPHWAQKRCRACQSISERASARIAASPAGDQRGQRAHVDASVSSTAAQDRRRWHRPRNRARPSPMPRKISVAPRLDQPRATARPAASRAPAGAVAQSAASGRAAAGCARLGIGQQPGDPARVAPALADAVERVAGKAVDVFHAEDANAFRPCRHLRSWVCYWSSQASSKRQPLKMLLTIDRDAVHPRVVAGRRGCSDRRSAGRRPRSVSCRSPRRFSCAFPGPALPTAAHTSFPARDCSNWCNCVPNRRHSAQRNRRPGSSTPLPDRLPATVKSLRAIFGNQFAVSTTSNSPSI